MNEADRDERLLVTAARRGDQDAQETLVRHLLPLVYNVVGRALTRRPDVDQVAHEAMLRVMRDLPAPGLATRTQPGTFPACGRCGESPAGDHVGVRAHPPSVARRCHQDCDRASRCVR